MTLLDRIADGLLGLCLAGYVAVLAAVAVELRENQLAAKAVAHLPEARPAIALASALIAVGWPGAIPHMITQAGHGGRGSRR